MIMLKMVYFLLATVLFSSQAMAEHRQKMSFFITSEGPGDGADLGGLVGADSHCKILAEAAGVHGKTWRAYLSTTSHNGDVNVNARDRIGTGPWFNANGVQIAGNVDDLHSENNKLNKENSISETGQVINGRGDRPNRHDILTGSQLNGTAFTNDADTTCKNWTSSDNGSGQVGHHDRTGGGSNPTAWNSAHGSRGCSQKNLQSSGGDGLFYCFAID